MKQLSELEYDFERQRIAFIHTELDTGATFAEVARTEMSLGNHRRAEHNLDLAAKACSEARRRLDECDRIRMRGAFDAALSKLQALDAQISELRQKWS